MSPLSSWFHVDAIGVVLFSALAGALLLLLFQHSRRVRRERRSLEAQQSLTGRLTSLLETANDAVLRLDASGQIVEANDRAVEMYGYSSAELLQKNVRDLRSPDHRTSVDDDLRNALAEDGFRMETVHVRRDGTCFPVEVSARPIRAHGRLQYHDIVRDISRQREAEPDLLQAKQAAEAASGRLELANVQLEAAIKMARESMAQAKSASAAKGEFLASMSHEIRTPMNGIIGMTGLLLGTPLGPEQREYAEIVRNSGDALLSIVNGILDFSKIEAGKLDLESIDFDPRSVVEDTTEMFAMKADEKGLQLTCLLAADVPASLRGDPGRLRQVLLNLVGNAIKFTARGEVAIRVALDSQDDDRATLRFSVRDTGIGIPANRINSVFQSFTQVDSSITRRFGGTGLGLAISRSLVELMGGQIGVESAPPNGSMFWFTTVFEKRAATAVPPREPGHSIAGLRILVVDDNATNRFVMTEQLRSFGCSCDDAPDALAALAKLRAGVETADPFDVAVLDEAMPDIDGRTLAAQILADDRIRGTRLVMSSSIARRADAARLRDLGFSAALIKPVKATDLRACLLALVEGTDARAEGSRHHPANPSFVGDQGRQLRALVADDNAVNQKLTVRLLERLGFRADAVGSGLEALKELDTAPYDLVLMDVQMPDMDGFEATRAIRHREGDAGGHLPIIAVTAHAMTGDRERCLAAGMDGYVSKPIERRNLVTAIEAVIGAPREFCVEAPALASPPAEVFNREELVARLEGDEHLMVELIDAFLEDAPGTRSELARAMEAGELRTLARLGHLLKGSAATLGAHALKFAAAELERVGGAGELKQAQAQAGAMDREYDRLIHVLSATRVPS